MEFELATAMGWFVIFIFSATVHEAAHAWVARLGGDDTAYLGGQVSLNPVPHIQREPFGMVLLPIVTVILMGWPIGYASAPYDPRWAIRYPRRAALMALAGPASNLLVACICLLIMWIGIHSEMFFPPRGSFGFTDIITGGSEDNVLGGAMLLSMLLTMNFLLFVLNILPLPPLDGSNVLMMFMKNETAVRYYEFISHPFLAMIGILFVFKVFAYIFLPAFVIFLQLLNI